MIPYFWNANKKGHDRSYSKFNFRIRKKNIRHFVILLSSPWFKDCTLQMLILGINRRFWNANKKKGMTDPIQKLILQEEKTICQFVFVQSFHHSFFLSFFLFVLKIITSKCLPSEWSWSSRLGLENTPTISLQRNKTPPTSVLDMTLNYQMVRIQ